MVVRRNSWCIICICVLILSSPPIKAQDVGAESVSSPPASWYNIPSSDFNVWELAGIGSILVNGQFVFGFHCGTVGSSCLLAISIFQSSFGGNSELSPVMVWSANRNNPVQFGARLQYTNESGLVLEDINNTAIWSTRTKGEVVSSMNLTAEGNLVLFASNNRRAWQSFDHPTDTLLPGQRLVSEQKLRANVSQSNSSEGLYSFAINPDGATAYVEPNSEPYEALILNISLEKKTGRHYANFEDLMIRSGSGVSSASFIQLGSDGHLRAYAWGVSQWTVVSDLFNLDRCDYPLACGRYGICSDAGCSCPGSEDENGNAYFKQMDHDAQTDCSPITPVSCESLMDQTFLELTYMPSLLPSSMEMIYLDKDNCKETCKKNCSCKMALVGNAIQKFSEPLCALLFEAYSFAQFEDAKTYFLGQGNAEAVLNTTFIKVQVKDLVVSQSPSVSVSPKKKKNITVKYILGSIAGAIFGVFLLCTLIILKIKKGVTDDGHEFLDHISGMPRRFSYEELKVITKNFTDKLGQGGFGSVFKGTLPDGTEVAVKCLEGFGAVTKSFITEVQTIGSIHHFNLVRLVGFCAEQFQRLLVYECMSNGSLDVWIFHKNQQLVLSWETRRKIILDISRGLAYLHDECWQKIIHLDIKPQNILLDENFNAKVSDFGLSKLIGREQSQVVTTMRGTPGYMAPEWLSSIITEKADVYSFGIVVLEILCGRKNVDRFEQEEDMHLLKLFKRKAEEDQLLDLVDKYNDDMQANALEVLKVMRVAAWCLQNEHRKRPSMSMVAKILEGSMEVDANFNFEFSDLLEPSAGTSEIQASILTGPR